MSMRSFCEVVFASLLQLLRLRLGMLVMVMRFWRMVERSLGGRGVSPFSSLFPEFLELRTSRRGKNWKSSGMGGWS